MAVTPQSRPTTVRHKILALLVGFSLASYVLRTNITVAAKLMMPELGLSEIQMGQIFSAFMLGYAIFQIPGGILGDRKGPRLVLTLAALWWGVTTLLTGLVPGLLIGSGLGAFVTLIVLRFTLGESEAATYPVAARTVANWFPFSERTFANATVIAGATLGMVFSPPLISWLMVTWGWREIFFVTCVLGFLLAFAWRWYAADQPENHHRISDAELITIYAGQPEAVQTAPTSWRALLGNRNLRLISLSYFLDSFVLFVFVFWFYLYLVDERGFGLLKGGFYNSLPYAFAMVMIPACGRLCDGLAGRRGRTRGRRLVAMSCLMLSAVFLLTGAKVAAPLPAIICFSLSVGFLMSTEGPFWSSAVEVAGQHPGAAGGIMNTAGNLGGVVSTAIAPILVKQFGWFATFTLCSILAVLAGLIWFLIKVEQTSGAVAVSIDEFEVGEVSSRM
jgi:MFS transporter, ACS family, glucarate transporter